MEIWKDIPNYEGIYQVSSLGRVKSLGNNKQKKEKILKPATNPYGYVHVVLSKDAVSKSMKTSQLVAMAFLNHVPCGHKIVVDHIDDNKLNNTLENLQLITQRENTCKTQGKYSSNYRGVCWNRFENKWVSHIRIDGKHKRLGAFNDELEASNAYQIALKNYLDSIKE
jgi:hypothetical protein